MTRRKRSNITKAQAVYIVETFAMRIERFCETTASRAMDNFDGQHLDVVLRVNGCPAFGFADNFFEALRVLGRHKLPRSTAKGDQCG